MKDRSTLLLLLFALGCGGRSDLDGPGGASLERGMDATTSSSSGGAPNGSGTDGGGSSGSGDGSFGGRSGDSASGEGGDSKGPEVPPSCAPGGAGMTNCGPGGSGTESCCASLEVTGGTFYRTYLSGSGDAGMPIDPATVSNFRLDRYLVTVGRFRQFVAAWQGGWLPAPGAGKHSHLNGGLGLVNSGASADAGTVYETGWLAAYDDQLTPTSLELGCMAPYSTVTDSTWLASPSGDELLPINCENWYEADAFCIWDGGFLPTEAEWKYAVAGGSRQRAFPWGAAGPGTTDQYAVYDCNYPDGSLLCADGGVENIAPVGTALLGIGTWGQLDLVGDVFEWVPDWFADYVTPCTDCAALTSESFAFRVITGGGAFDSTSVGGFAGRAYDVATTGRDADVGFRCARAP
jgi:sulfatase modifying factor 1